MRFETDQPDGNASGSRATIDDQRGGVGKDGHGSPASSSKNALSAALPVGGGNGCSAHSLSKALPQWNRRSGAVQFSLDRQADRGLLGQAALTGSSLTSRVVVSSLM